MKILEAEYVKGVTRPGQFADETVSEVCFIGRSNVGKSSMINRLVMRKVAKTSSTPGATRVINLYKVLYEASAAKRWMLFSDFPGFGYAKVPKEMYRGWQEMIENYMRENRRAHTLVWAYDVRREIDDLDRFLIDWVFSLGLDFVLVLTKIDKETRNNVMKKKMLFSRYFGESRVLTFSAKDGDGRAELLGYLTAPERQPTSL